MANHGLAVKVRTGKTWDANCGWWEAWAEDEVRREMIGHYRTVTLADAALRVARRFGVLAAAQAWERTFADRILGFPVHFYYPIVEAATGDELEHLTWVMRCVERVDGFDVWKAQCKVCDGRVTIAHAAPSAGDLRPFEPALPVCAHSRKARGSFLDDYPPEYRDDIAARFDP